MGQFFLKKIQAFSQLLASAYGLVARLFSFWGWGEKGFKNIKCCNVLMVIGDRLRIILGKNGRNTGSNEKERGGRGGEEEGRDAESASPANGSQ